LRIVTDPAPDAGSTSKAQQTRAAIVAAATKLFRTGGYDATTMRAVAQEAGVSVGNAYYYFGSKEHLVLAFYDEIYVAHVARCEEVLATKKGFAERLTAVLEIWVDVADSSHEFAGKFFKHAAEPTSPLSVFSPESAPTREAAIALMGRVVKDSDLKVAPALREELPLLLWLVQMGMVLFWVYDGSPDRTRTRQLVRQAVPILDKLLRATRIPGVRGIADDVVVLVKSLVPPPH
jgi:AcrR family transcriptional regulator